jgi:hypothetical protein
MRCARPQAFSLRVMIAQAYRRSSYVSPRPSPAQRFNHRRFRLGRRRRDSGRSQDLRCAWAARPFRDCRAHRPEHARRDGGARAASGFAARADRSCFDDFRVGAVKLGVLANKEVIDALPMRSSVIGRPLSYASVCSFPLPANRRALYFPSLSAPQRTSSIISRPVVAP